VKLFSEKSHKSTKTLLKMEKNIKFVTFRNIYFVVSKISILIIKGEDSILLVAFKYFISLENKFKWSKYSLIFHSVANLKFIISDNIS